MHAAHCALGGAHSSPVRISLCWFVSVAAAVKSLRRGVKEVVKAVRKGEKG